MEYGRDNSRTLLRKAAGDLAVPTVLKDAEGIDDWSWAFHARQAIEKSLKAVLADARIQYPYTHRLAKLYDLLEEHALSLPPHVTELEPLSPFGSLTRYEEIEEPSVEGLQVSDIVRQCTDVLRWAEAQTGLSSERQR